MKKYFTEIITKRTQKLEELKKRSDESQDLNEVRSLGSQMEEVKEELRTAKEKLAEIEAEEKRTAEAEKKENAEVRSVILSSYGASTGAVENAEQRNKELAELEERGKALKEGRAVTVSSGTLLLPKHTGTKINDTFKQVSSLLDMVDFDQMIGGESYQESFVVSYGQGGSTDEGADYTTAEPVFGYADINKVKITAYAEISEEAKKLTHVEYARKVDEACRVALEKEMARQMLVGTGNKQMMGIFASPVAIDEDKDIELTEINNKTLNEFMFNFGGDEEVESEETLVLNKLTLKDMSEVEKQDGSLFYNIDNKNKTVNTVPYSINSNVTPFATATEGQFVGAYGDPMAYKIVQFSPVEQQESPHYKFKQGMICIKAVVFVGGNVVKQDGFIRAKKHIPTT